MNNIDTANVLEFATATALDGWVRTKYFLHGRELEFKPVVNDEGVSFDLPGEVGVLLTSRWRGLALKQEVEPWL